MYRRLFFIVIALILIIGCKPLKESQFRPTDKGYQLMPPLNLECSIVSNAFPFNKKIVSELTSSLEQEINMNVINHGFKVGRIEVKGEINVTFKKYGPIMTGLTFGVWGLLGLPFAPYQSTIVSDRYNF